MGDVECTVEWYRATLGLQPERLDEWRRGEVLFASLRVSPTTIVDLLEAPRTGENVNHVALAVTGVDLHELAASGTVEVDSGPAALFGAQGTGIGLYIRDPDGNLVDLRTY